MIRYQKIMHFRIEVSFQLSTFNDKYVALLQRMLSRLEEAARGIWETLKAHQHSNLCYVSQFH